MGDAHAYTGRGALTAERAGFLPFDAFPEGGLLSPSPLSSSSSSVLEASPSLAFGKASVAEAAVDKASDELDDDDRSSKIDGGVTERVVLGGEGATG